MKDLISRIDLLFNRILNRRNLSYIYFNNNSYFERGDTIQLWTSDGDFELFRYIRKGWIVKKK